MHIPYINYLKSKGRFAVWIFTFLFLLATIPLLLNANNTTTAKFFGVFVLVLIVFALWVWRIQTRKKADRLARIRLTTNEVHWLNKHIPFYSNLNKEQKRIFEDRVGIFLAEIIVTEIDNEVPEKSTCLYVASSAIIAYWGLPYWNYGELSEVLVYPSNFDMNNELNKRGLVSGKVHHGGLMDSTMILSLPTLIHGFDNQTDKNNVGVHEFAHLLDKADGSIYGLPFMLKAEDKQYWIDLVEREMTKIKDKDSTINAHGATSKEEFFAVLTEYYKERPQLLKNKHPEIFLMMNRFFNEIN